MFVGVAMENVINTLLVDDEVGCLDNLRHYLAFNCPRIHIVATAGNTETAARLLNTLPVDLAFFDVHLFDQNVFDVLPHINKHNIPVVFVTAYEQYALSAFKASALDYLLKPLETSEVLRSYEKVVHYFDGLKAGIAKQQLLSAPCNKKITLRHGENIYRIRKQRRCDAKGKRFLYRGVLRIQ